MSADSVHVDSKQSMNEAFPDVTPDILPLGNRVLVQIRRMPEKSSGGIVLIEDTKETVKWNMQTARVVALGPIAYCNRETGDPWPEGVWCRVGDFVRVPRWGGDRIELRVKGSDEPLIFVTFADHEIISKVVGDPLAQRTYVL